MQEVNEANLDPALAAAERGRLERIAAVHRELAELEAVDDAVAGGLRMRYRRGTGASMPYSIRLDRGEVEALERRAVSRGLKPTVLARNLIRIGLNPNGAADLAEAAQRVADAVDQLRRIVGASSMRTGFD
jgi:hypothetical protein